MLDYIVMQMTKVKREKGDYKQNVFYITKFGINLLAFYYEWLRYSLSI